MFKKQFHQFKIYLYSLLRKSQKYTKTDMVYLVKGGFWVNLQKIIEAPVGLAMTLVFANLLNPETYGTFRFVLSFTGIITIFSLKGINTALFKSISQGYDATIKLALKTRIKWELLSIVASLIISGYYFINDNHTLAICFLIMGAVMPIFQPFEMWAQYLNGKKDFKNLSKFNIITNILNVAFLITTILLTQNIFIIIFVNFASLSTLRVIFLILAIKKYPPNKNCDPEAINYGKHLSFMSILGNVSAKLDQILVFNSLGPINLAVYAFAKTPINLIRAPFSSLNSLIFPKLAQKNIENLHKTIYEKMFYLFLLILPVVILYILTAPYLFELFLPKYTNSVIYSQILSLQLLFYPVIFLSSLFASHAKKKELYLIRTIVPSFKIILLMILLPLYGIFGAIYAMLISDAINFILFLLLFRKMKCSK